MFTNNRSRQNMATPKQITRATKQTKGKGHNSSLAKNITSQHKSKTSTLFTLIRQFKPATLTRNNRLHNNRLNIPRPLVRPLKVLPNRRGLHNQPNLRQRRHTRKGQVTRTTNTFRHNSTRTLVTLATMSLHKFTNPIGRYLRGQPHHNRRAVLTHYNNGLNRAQTGRRSSILVTRRRTITLRHSHRAINNQSHRTNNQRRLSRDHKAKFRHIRGLRNFIRCASTKVSLSTSNMLSNIHYRNTNRNTIIVRLIINALSFVNRTYNR